jgi:3-deoxy-D-manno-octulosonate 8-phosphate phosphatase (KDO 8-P phosphatase)
VPDNVPEKAPHAMAELPELLRRIKAIAMDVDGVLTDGCVWWGPNGEEWKRFHFADIMGLSLARKSGLVVALISGENSPLVDRLAGKLGIADVHKDCKDKASALRKFSERHGLSLQEICFIGDDVNDLAALGMVGLSACPADARPLIREHCQVVANLGGGNGAVREVVDMLLGSAKMAGVGSLGEHETR